MPSPFRKQLLFWPWTKLGLPGPPGSLGGQIWKESLNVGKIGRRTVHSQVGLFLLFLDPEGYPTFFYYSYPTLSFGNKNPKSPQERAMELVPGLFCIIFHGESDRSIQTPWNIARTRENHDPRLFKCVLEIDSFSPKKGSSKNTKT